MLFKVDGTNDCNYFLHNILFFLLYNVLRKQLKILETIVYCLKPAVSGRAMLDRVIIIINHLLFLSHTE